MRSLTPVGVVALALLASPSWAQNRATIAVAPFTYSQGVSGPSEETDALTQKFVTALVQTRKFDVVERAQLDTLLDEMHLSEQGLTDPNRAVEAGRLLGADYFLLGEISVYDCSTEVRQIPHTTRWNRFVELTIVCDIRIVDTRSSRIASAERGQAEGEDREMHRRQPAADAPVDPAFLDGVERDLVAQLVLRVVDAVYPIRVISVNRRGVVSLNRGDGGGLEVGEEYDVFSEGEALIDPDTGENLGAEEERVARIRITQIQSRFSRASIVAGTPQAGNVCRPAQGAFHAAPLPPRDRQAPQITILRPQDGATVEDEVVRIWAEVTDNEDVSRVTVNGVECAVCPYTGNYNLPVRLELGANPLRIEAYDEAGNWSQASLTLHRQLPDTQAPTVQVTAPTQDQCLNTNPVTVYVTAEDDRAVTRVTIAGQDAVREGDQWCLNVRAREGRNAFAVEAYDAAGNCGTAHGLFRFDPTPPQVTIQSPQDGAVVSTRGVVVYVASDDPSVTRVLINGRAAQREGDRWCLNVPARPGANTIAVEAYDEAGNCGTASSSFTVDATAPTITITAPTQGHCLNTNPVTVYVSARDDQGVTRVTIGGRDAQREGDQWCLNVRPRTGENTIRAQAFDAAGNVGTAERTFVFDATPPDVTVLSPRNGATVSEREVTVFVGSNDSSITRVRINGREAVREGARWCLNVRATPGANALAVEAYDEAGNCGTATSTFTLDATAPTLTITAPTADQCINTNPVTVYVSARDDQGVTRVTVGGREAVREGEQWCLNVTARQGRNTVRVQAFDAAGNVGTAEQTFRFDATPPSVTILSPQDGATVTERDVTVFVGSDDPTVTRVLINGREAPREGERWCLAVRATPGANTINVEAFDEFGNCGTATSRFSYDGEPPAITIVAPTAGTLINRNPVTVVASVSDPSLDWVKIDGRDAIREGDQWCLGVTAREGRNRAVVEACDTAGNRARAQVEFVFDSTAPTIRVLSPDASAPLQGDRAVVVCAVQDANEVVRVTIGGQNAVREGENWCAEVRLRGAQTDVEILAWDAAGNRGRQGCVFTCDVTAPTVTILEPTANARHNQRTLRVVCEATDDVGVTRVTIAGREAQRVRNSNRYVLDLQPTEGTNSLPVEAFDAAGNVGRAQVTCLVDCTPPTVTATARILVAGRVDDLSCVLTINGQQVQYDRRTGEYQAYVTLNEENPTQLVIVATDSYGNATTVIHDLRPE